MSLSDYIFPVLGGGLLFTVSFFVGRSNLSCFWVVLLIFVNLLISKFWRIRQRKRIALHQASLREPDIILAHMKDLPSWVQFPDTERVEWINKVILQLWPFISDYSKKFIRKIVEPQLKLYLPVPLNSFTFEQIDIGQIPLRVSGIKVYTENVGRDKIIMDMDVSYAGDCDFVVSFGMFKGGLRQMQFKGKLRAVLSPLVPKLPVIGAATLCLLEEPVLDFELTGLGELIEFPGLMESVRAVVRAVIASICVIPNEIVVPLTLHADVVKLRFPEADGVLKLCIVQARNLENRDTFLTGKSDPYVIAAVGTINYRTKTVNNNLNPMWNESFEVVIDHTSSQKLNFEVFDEDFGSKDDFLGRLVLNMPDLKKKIYTDQWYKLEGVKNGEIRLIIRWFGLTSKTNCAEKIGKSSEAVLSIYLDSVNNLPMVKRDLEPSPYIEFSLATKKSKAQISTVRVKTCHPIYQQRFAFFIDQIEDEILKIEAKDSQEPKRSLGETCIPLKFLLREFDLELIQQKFQLVLGPHLAQAVLSVRLRYLHTTTEKSPSSDLSKIDVPLESTQSIIVGGAVVKREKHYVKSMNSPTRNTGLVQTKTVITPQYLSAKSESDEGTMGAAWLQMSVSEGASSVSNRPSRKNILQRLQENRFLSFGKLNRRRRSLSTNLDGYLGRVRFTVSYNVTKASLLLYIHEAEQLKALNLDNVADPYVVVKLIKSEKTLVGKRRTPLCSKTLSPIFKKTFKFSIHHSDLVYCKLLLEVKDSCNYGWLQRAPVMGCVSFDFSTFDYNQSISQWFALNPPNTLTRFASASSIPLDPLQEEK